MSKRASRVCAAAAAGLIATLAAVLPAGYAPAADADTPAAAAAAANAGTGAGADAGAGAGAVAGGEDIRDIRGPKALFPWTFMLELLAAGVALAMGGYALWYRRRHRPSRALEYFEIALQRLEELRVLMRPPTVREFSSAISDTVRRYIEAGFKVTATHQTTEEFLHDILRSPNTPLAPHRLLLAEFLRQCDLAKFAGMSLTTHTMEELHRSARTFIVTTSPKPRAKEAHDPLPAT